MSFLISCQRDSAKKDFIKKINKKYTAVVNFRLPLKNHFLNTLNIILFLILKLILYRYIFIEVPI